MLAKYRRGTREHAVLELWWNTALRLGGTRALDLDDLRPDEQAVTVRHLPESETSLKTKKADERWV